VAVGERAALGNLKLGQCNADYGNMGRPSDGSASALRNLYMRDGPAPAGMNNGPVAYIRGDTNFVGLSFLSFAALGAAPSQIVYGYSIFPNDVFDSNDLVGLTDVPLNTSGSVNGGDIYGGTFAIFSSAAAESETTEQNVDLQITKTSETYGAASHNRKSIPGNDKLYHVTVTNLGDGSPGPNSLVIIDSLPIEVSYWGGDLDDSGPETHSVAWSDSNSDLTFSYSSDVRFSQGSAPPASFSDCNYTPPLDYDQTVRFVCIRPQGTMAGDPGDPSFTVTFRVRID